VLDKTTCTHQQVSFQVHLGQLGMRDRDFCMLTSNKFHVILTVAEHSIYHSIAEI